MLEHLLTYASLLLKVLGTLLNQNDKGSKLISEKGNKFWINKFNAYNCATRYIFGHLREQNIFINSKKFRLFKYIRLTGPLNKRTSSTDSGSVNNFTTNDDGKLF